MPLPKASSVLVTAVDSSVLATVAYDYVSQQLWLEFRNLAVYCYFGVPPSLYQHLLAAPSKGTYFNRHIRGNFPFHKPSAITPLQPAPAQSVP